jgi:hypothetical protein
MLNPRPISLPSTKVALRAAVILFVALALTAVGLCVGLRSFESIVTFHPERAREAEWRVPGGCEEVWFRTSDGVRLCGGKPAKETASAAGRGSQCLGIWRQVVSRRSYSVHADGCNRMC